MRPWAILYPLSPPHWPGADLLLPLLALPGALLLLACPNPTRQAQRFRPAWWKALLAAAALIWSLVSLVGVETFIYANF